MKIKPPKKFKKVKYIEITGNGINEDEEKYISFTELCRCFGFSYNYLKKFTIPFEYKGYSFKRKIWIVNA